LVQNEAAGVEAISNYDQHGLTYNLFGIEKPLILHMTCRVLHFECSPNAWSHCCFEVHVGGLSIYSIANH